MTIEEMKRRKTALGLTNEMIAQAAGVPLSTIQKIMSGVTKAPRKLTLEAIESVLFAEEQRRSNRKEQLPAAETVRHAGFAYGDLPNNSAAGMVKEPVTGYSLANTAEKKDGEYTLDDYYALPDERRVELIDGVFYDMTCFSASAQIHTKENVRSICLLVMSDWIWTTRPWCSRIFL